MIRPEHQQIRHIYTFTSLSTHKLAQLTGDLRTIKKSENVARQWFEPAGATIIFERACAGRFMSSKSALPFLHSLTNI